VKLFNQRNRNRFIRYFSLSIVSVGAILLLTSQQKHGRFSRVVLEAKPLEITQPVVNHRISTDVTSKLGGIASFLTASPEPALEVQSLGITYNPSESDGSRLELKINQNEIICKLPDWQLIPIVQFVNSTNHACITLLGDLVDQDLQKEIQLNEGHIINYHPAFLHTLLGACLLQNELMLISLDALDGPPLPNETPVSQQLAAFNKIQQILGDIQKELSEKHRSWMLSERQNDIFFTIHDKQLEISLTPEYYFWRFASDASDLDEIKNQQRFSAIKSILLHEFETDLAIYNNGLTDENSFRKVILKRASSSVQNMIDLHHSYAESYFSELDLRNLSGALASDNLDDFLNSLPTQELVAIWNSAVQINTLYRVIPLREYSEALNKEIDLIRNINPAAWDATMNLMKYSSFFRYIQQTYPFAWKEFATSLEGMELEDHILTPTAIYPSVNSHLEQLFN